MEKLSEKQTPDFMEMKKTLVGLGNVLIQAGLADELVCKYYPALEDLSFSCGEFRYEATSSSYDEESYTTFVENVKSFLRAKVEDYEKRIFALECSKAVIDVYLSENK